MPALTIGLQIADISGSNFTLVVMISTLILQANRDSLINTLEISLAKHQVTKLVHFTLTLNKRTLVV